MGLEEKRMVKRLKEEVVPQAEAELESISGTKLIYEVDWESFADDRDALSYFESRIVGEMAEAMRDICRDDLGKESVAERIKRIKVRNLSTQGCDDIVLNGTTLNISCDWGYGSLWDSGSIIERVGALL